MQIGSVAGIASSALRVEGQRVAQSAQNVANVNTPGYAPQRIDTVSLAGGGVGGITLPAYGPSMRALQSDGSAFATSNTDLASEIVTQMSSLRALQANIAALRTADDMLGEVLNIKA
jgi:flagellar basal body rod protein FlgG